MMRFLLKGRGSRDWDIGLRFTGIIALLAIPALMFAHGSEPLVLLVVAVLWLRCPAAAFSFIGLEPLLMLYGQLYPVWEVVTIATLASVAVEVISLHVMRGMLSLELLQRVRSHVQGSRLLRLFERNPPVVVGVAAFSPLPDWLTRSIAAVARYPVGRYVVADTIGRLPKFVIPVVLGGMILVPQRLLLAVTLGSVVLGTLLALLHWRHVARGGRPT